ncbi:phosphatidylethanolamine N-methyltransferase family domain-containing protein [Mycobacterium haemophilum]
MRSGAVPRRCSDSGAQPGVIWILLLYLAGATLLIHRQVLREEDFMRQRYGQEYLEYCSHVRRYI